jgi:hypothetical protein
MHRMTLAFLIAFTLSSGVFAQTANPYNGTWTITFEGRKTEGLESTVVVKDGGGTYQEGTSARQNRRSQGELNDPCVGREAPIVVQVASSEELVFKVNRSQVLAGCSDRTFKFKKVDDKTLKAETTDGRVITLTRK